MVVLVVFDDGGGGSSSSTDKGWKREEWMGRSDDNKKSIERICMECREAN